MGSPIIVELITILGMRWSEFVNEETVRKSSSAKEAPKASLKITAPKVEPQTKAQKRRANAQVDFKTGEKPRGWNWVDLLSHVRRGESIWIQKTYIHSFINNVSQFVFLLTLLLIEH